MSSTTDLDRLRALRERLEGRLRDPLTSDRDLAALAVQYRATIADLARLDGSTVASPLDDLAKRRSRRSSS